jgi:predicted ATPase/class 3 adenylate cyclase/Tfp pilus assembly protein PilF
MTNLPTGVVTFLFTDIEGSTKLWQKYPEAMTVAQACHDRVLREAIESNNGYIFQFIGDAFCAAFQNVGDALRAAIESQASLNNETWGDAVIKVRMGIHTDKAEVQENGDYQGYMTLSRTQRLMSAGHGGQVLISFSTQELVRNELPEGITLHDMGERRLKDLVHPEHIYQLNIENLPVDFPALKTLDVNNHNIPASTTEFIGREKELENLRKLLGGPKCRLITLTGLGGVGKTRLAQESARACADMFTNGAWHVPLAAVEAEGIIPAVGNMLNFPFTAGDHKKQLFNFLRQKELLLVLDNFEHLLDSSALLSDILKMAPEVKLLVTSRERLDIEGEWVVELSGLDVGSLSAAQLFIQSAKRARAEIQIKEQDHVAITEICQMVGGLPLGIEIAAAWTRSMECETIANEIRKSLDFLASTRRDIPERQRSLRAVFESSWEKLTEAEQKAFAALSVFRGGFTREAAEQVTGGSITALVDKSLVQRNEARFELQEVMRQFAEEKLNANKEQIQQARGAHTIYFADWARKCGKADVRESFPLMTHEFENVRAAWGWASGHADKDALANLAPFTKKYMDLQGRYREGIELFQNALAGLGAPANAEDLPLDMHGRLIVLLLMYKAILVADAGESETSKQVLESCLAYFRRAQAKVQIAVCLNGLGSACRFLGQEEEAAAYYREGLEIARSINNRDEESTALNNLALAINTLGRFDEAERLHRECLALRREMDDYPGISSSLINLGVVLFDQHRYEEAKPLLYEAIEISRQLNQTRQQAASLGNLGGILLKEGKFDEALNLFLQGLEIHRNTGYRFGMAIALDNVGTVHYHLGNKEEALFYLRQSIREARDIRSDLIVLDALVSIAALRARDGDNESALELIDLIRNHPKVDPETVQNIEKLLPQVVEGMGASAVHAAEERGKARELGDVIAEILSDQ